MMSQLKYGEREKSFCGLVESPMVGCIYPPLDTDHTFLLGVLWTSSFAAPCALAARALPPLRL